MKLTLETEKIVVLSTEKTKTLNTLTVLRMVDVPSQRKVKVFIKELKAPVTLWEGDVYDAIGQWTDLDVEKRLIELYS